MSLWSGPSGGSCSHAGGRCRRAVTVGMPQASRPASPSASWRAVLQPTVGRMGRVRPSARWISLSKAQRSGPDWQAARLISTSPADDLRRQSAAQSITSGQFLTAYELQILPNDSVRLEFSQLNPDPATPRTELRALSGILRADFTMGGTWTCFQIPDSLGTVPIVGAWSLLPS